MQNKVSCNQMILENEYIYHEQIILLHIIIIVVIVPEVKQSQILLCRLRTKSYFIGFAQQVAVGIYVASIAPCIVEIIIFPFQISRTLNGFVAHRWKKYLPLCEPIFQLPKFSVKLRDFWSYLPCKIAQIIVISRQILLPMILVGLEASDK